MATSFDDAWKLYQASKPELEETLDAAGLKLLYTVAWPPQGLYAKKEINSTADMEGVKFRAYNAATEQLAQLMGAVPTKIEAAELTQAFATGVADSMISSGSTGYDSKIWEHVKYWYDVQAWLPKNMVVVNKNAWEGLDENLQKVVLEAAAAAEENGWAKARELSDWYKEQLAANGMVVEGPSDKLKAEFQEIGERSEEHTSELQSLMRISYAVFCLKKKKKINQHNIPTIEIDTKDYQQSSQHTHKE